MVTTVAIIEDELSIAKMYQFKLEQQGYRALVAHDAKTGLKMIKEHMPSLILLDLRMPGMSGDEMLEKMRSTTWGSDIRVIILTNISKNEAPQKLRFLNVDRYVVKAHHTPAQIVSMVDETLGVTRHNK